MIISDKNIIDKYDAIFGFAVTKEVCLEIKHLPLSKKERIKQLISSIIGFIEVCLLRLLRGVWLCLLVGGLAYLAGISFKMGMS